MKGEACSNEQQYLNVECNSEVLTMLGRGGEFEQFRKNRIRARVYLNRHFDFINYLLEAQIVQAYSSSLTSTASTNTTQ